MLYALRQLVDLLASGWYITPKSAAETPEGDTICHDWWQHFASEQQRASRKHIKAMQRF